MQIESVIAEVARTTRTPGTTLAVEQRTPSEAQSRLSQPSTSGTAAPAVTAFQSPLSADAVTALQQSGNDDGPASAFRPPSPPPLGEATTDSDSTSPQGASVFAPPPPSETDETEDASQTGADEENTEEEVAAEDEEGADGLTPEEEAIVRELRARDAEVRRHEQAHAAAGGQFAGAPSYEYQRGPDGRLYAVGGEVRIDTSPIPGDPQATIAKLQTVRRAALAPTSPSPQDQRVAAEAQRQIAEARGDLRQAQADERERVAEQRAEEAERAEQTGTVDATAPTPVATGEAPQTLQAVPQVAAVVDTNPIDVTTVTRVIAGLSSGPDTDAASRGLASTQAFLQTQSLASDTSRPAVFA